MSEPGRAEPQASGTPKAPGVRTFAAWDPSRASLSRKALLTRARAPVQEEREVREVACSWFSCLRVMEISLELRIFPATGQKVVAKAQPNAPRKRRVLVLQLDQVSSRFVCGDAPLNAICIDHPRLGSVG